MQRTVRDVLAHKPIGVTSITPSATIREAAARMRDAAIGALLVRGEREPLGLLSERDLVVHLADGVAFDPRSRVDDVMCRDIVRVQPEDELQRCMQLMTDRRVRHLLVCVDGRPVGIVSIGDVVKALIDEQAFVIEQLDHYITGHHVPGDAVD